MRILIFTERFVPEERATAHLYYELAKGLVDRGHEVGVVTKMPSGYVPLNGQGRQNSPPPKREWFDGIDVIRVRGFSSLHRVLMVRAADHLLAGATFALAARKWDRADILLIYSPPLPLAVAGWFYERWTGAPYVLNLHDIYPQTLIEVGVLKNRVVIRLAEVLEAMAYHKAARIVVPAPTSRDILITRKGVSPQRVDHIPNWVDTDRVFPGPKENAFRRAHGLSHHFVVSYAGSMGFGQDLAPVLAGARALQHRGDIVFFLVGDGACKSKWEQMADGLRNVRFLPLQPKDQFFEVLRASDVCLVPLAESLRSPAIPGKTQHIMAVGRPMVAMVNPQGDAGQLITRSQCGVVVRPGDPEELVRVLGLLYGNRELGDRLGANGRAYAEQYFSLRGALEGYEAIFEAVLRGRHAPAVS